MYNKIFKNYQVNVGNPYQVRNPLNFQTITRVDTDGKEDFEQELPEYESSELIIEQASEKADLLVREAQIEAERLIESAQNGLEELKNTVENEARQQGYEDGFNEAKKEYEDLIEEAEAKKEHAHIEYKEVLERIESDVVNVILDIARKVVATELMSKEEDILFLVKEAFEKCSNKEDIVLKVSVRDYEIIIENKDKLLSMSQGIGELEIKKDSSLKDGDCIVETPHGIIDSGIQTKFKKIEEAFREVIGK